MHLPLAILIIGKGEWKRGPLGKSQGSEPFIAHHLCDKLGGRSDAAPGAVKLERLRSTLKPGMLITVGLILVASAAVAYSYLEVVSQPSAERLPASISGVALERALYGRQAVEAINRMHIGSSGLASGAVGWYGSHGQVRLYVSGAPLEILAWNWVRAMERRIAESETPFSLLGVTEQSGRRVYELEGLGQRHHFFQVGELVVWLAAEAALIDSALEEVLAFYCRDPE